MEDIGAVSVFHSSAAGLCQTREQFWSQDSLNVDGMAEAYDAFGSALAVGDFDGDGYADRQVGVPREDKGGEVDSVAPSTSSMAPSVVSVPTCSSGVRALHWVAPASLKGATALATLWLLFPYPS